MESDDEVGPRPTNIPVDSLPRSGPVDMTLDPGSPHTLPRHRPSTADVDPDYPLSQPMPIHMSSDASRSARSRHSMSHTHSKRHSTNKPISGMALNILPSAPASPPTPAPSPTPYQRPLSWTSAGENEFAFMRDARGHFCTLNLEGRQRCLAELLDMCDSQTLSFVQNFVSPRLKKDPFKHLPDELCLRVSLSSLFHSQRLRA
jgi:hypothetical protein